MCKCRYDTYIYDCQCFRCLFPDKVLNRDRDGEGEGRGREGEREGIRKRRRKEKGGVGRRGEQEEDKGEDVRGGRKGRRKEGERKVATGVRQKRHTAYVALLVCVLLSPWW